MRLEKELATRLLTEHPNEAAAALETLPDVEAAQVLAEAPPEAAAHVLSSLAPHRGSAVLGHLTGAAVAGVIAHLGFDHSAALVRRMPEKPRDGFVQSLPPELARPLRQLLDFPVGTAGSLMDTTVLALPAEVTVSGAVDQIRERPDHVRYNLYILDRDRRLVGVLTLRELLLADGSDTIGSIGTKDVLSIGAHESQAAVLAHPAWQEAPSLPVVDRQGVYLGAIRYRAWRRLAEARSARTRRDTTTADALGDLFSAGVAGVVGAMTDLASRATTGDPDGAR